MPHSPPTIAALRHRLTLEYPQRTPDAAGGFTTTWLAVADVWAEITPRSGTERLEHDGQKSRLTHTIVVRTRPEITPERRFRLGPRLFEIRAVHAADAQNTRLRCLCEEVNL